jgi:hypothetical protein
LLTGADAKLLGADEPYELDEPNPPAAGEPYAEDPLDDVFPKPFDDPPNPPLNELSGPGGPLVAAICGNLPVSIISSSSIFGIIKSLYVC